MSNQTIEVTRRDLRLLCTAIESRKDRIAPSEFRIVENLKILGAQDHTGTVFIPTPLYDIFLSL
jgi:hypothetical protein